LIILHKNNSINNYYYVSLERPGLEPGKSTCEGDVLPLDYPPLVVYICTYIYIYIYIQGGPKKVTPRFFANISAKSKIF
jgi:hypothetical protein